MRYVNDLGQGSIEVGEDPRGRWAREKGLEQRVHRVERSAGASYTRRVIRYRVILVVAGLVLAACRPETVALGYRFTEGSTTSYRMTAHASARWDVGGPGQGSYDVDFVVEETVTSVESDGAVVEVEMTPTSVHEAGLPSPGLERRTFSLRLGPDGEVLEVLQLDGLAAGAIEHDELAFIGTYRPPMPPGEVELWERWSDEGAIQLGPAIQQIATTGSLVGFRKDGGRSLARIAFTGSGPLEWRTTLPQGEAELVGEVATRGTGLFDLGGGMLDAATSVTSGKFAVRVLPESGEAPITGSLKLDLDLEVERVD